MSDPRLLDKDWRVSHLYKIKTKKAEFRRFVPNKPQQHFKENAHTRNIILKSRQLGFTTYETIDSLDDIAFNKNFDALFIAHGLEPAKDLFSNKIKLAWENFKLKHLYRDATDSARMIKLGFGKSELDEDEEYSSIVVSTSGRSGTYQRVHISEFAKLCKRYPVKAKEVIEGTIPAVPTHGRVDIESTAEESSGYFYSMFWAAWNRGEPTSPTQFKAHFYNWQWDEEIEDTEVIKDIPVYFREYQEKFNLTDKEISYYYMKYQALGEDDRSYATMKQEYPTTPEEAFEASGTKLFDHEVLGEQPITEPIKVIGKKLKIYEEYKLGHKYGMGCDVAEGVGQDSSTIVVMDFSKKTPNVVATYADDEITPDMFAHVIRNVAERYEQPLVAVEVNNHGHTTLSTLITSYPKRHIYAWNRTGSTIRWGWRTTGITKPQMMIGLSSALNEDLIDMNVKEIISEAKRYDKEDMRIVRFDPGSDEHTQHYDLLTGMAICYQIRADALITKHTNARNNRSGKKNTTKRGKGLRGT